VEPTVRELMGRPQREGARGRSLLPLIRGEKRPERPAFTEGQNVRAVRAGGWLYLRRSDGRLEVSGQPVVRMEELYDLGADPEQHHDRTADAPEALARMRALFESETPIARDAPVSVLHLRVAPEARPHVIEGTLKSEGTLSLRQVAGAEATPVDKNALRLVLRGAAQVDVVVDPPTAAVELALRKDGTPLGPSQLLIGPFALPLLADRPTLRIEGERLTWLDAARAPFLGERGEVLLWRDPSALTPLVEENRPRARREVADMMRRWGYAQPGK
jgi:hypothetical protein